MFSDRFRNVKIALSVIVILGLCLLSLIRGVADSRLRSQEQLSCIENPPLCIDTVHLYRGRVVSSNEQAYVIAIGKEKGQQGEPSDPERLIVSINNFRDISVGDKIELIARFESGGTVELIDYRQTDWRLNFLKYAISIVGLILGIRLFFLSYRLSPKKPHRFLRY